MFDLFLIRDAHVFELAVRGSVVGDDAGSSIAEALAFLPEASRAVLDLTGVGEIDDRCVELIRRAILRRQADDVTIAVAIGDPEIRESLEAFGLELIVPLIDGLRDARRSAGGLIAA